MHSPRPDLDEQVARFRERLPLYCELCGVLKDALTAIAVPICVEAIVQARPKGVASFAEKVIRKKKYTNPIEEITDLCGARVIVNLESEVKAVCREVEQMFDIDQVNSLDQRSRLATGEFGYRSMHYVVRLRSERFPGVNPKLLSLRSEIQVRTIVQHAWSAIGHDRIYKSPFRPPESVRRDAARIAANLETVDGEFQRLVSCIEDYRTQFGPHREGTRLAEEEELLAALRRHDPENPSVPLRAAEIAIAREDFSQAIVGVREFVRGSDATTTAPQTRELTPTLQLALGYALCRAYEKQRAAPEFVEGEALLQRATERMPDRVIVWLRRAEVLEPMDPHRALECYRRAFALDPFEPASLAGYVRLRLTTSRDASFVELLRPSLLAAIERCEVQASFGMELPWAHFRSAWFHLLLGPEHRFAALRSLARGVALPGSAAAGEALAAVQLLGECVTDVAPARADIAAVTRFLQVALAVRETSGEFRDQVCGLATPEAPPIRGPVVIVAGGCDPARQEEMTDYGAILRGALREFRGTVISGGTQQGVAGLVAELGVELAGRIHTIGYLPRRLPDNGSATRDPRYHELRSSPGEVLGPFEPLQNWIDLLASGIAPGEVTVLGLGGGDIAAFEYRLALALGARVGIIVDSGREADRLIHDSEWQESRRLLRLPRRLLDAATMRAFTHPPAVPPPLAEHLDRLGEMAHEYYLRDHPYSEIDAARHAWKELRADFRESNREQMACAADILATENYAIVPMPGTEIALPDFTAGEVARMAELEHGRWNIERLASGWTYAETKDPAKKTSPHLVPWTSLSAELRERDRSGIRKYAEILRQAGFAVVKRKATD